MIFVTGGSGFIGSNFIREWLNSNRGAIVNLDKLTYASRFAAASNGIHSDKLYFFLRRYRRQTDGIRIAELT